MRLLHHCLCLSLCLLSEICSALLQSRIMTSVFAASTELKLELATFREAKAMHLPESVRSLGKLSAENRYVNSDLGVFGSLLSFPSQSKEEVVLTKEGKRNLLEEIVLQYRHLDSSSMAKCLWLIGKMNFNHDDARVSVIIEDIINFLAQKTSSLTNEKSGSVDLVSAEGTAKLLICLARTGGRWNDLPLLARELLQSRIMSSVFPASTEIKLRSATLLDLKLVHLPDIVCSLGKLSAEYRHFNPTFRSALLTAITHTQDATQESYSVSKLLYGLTLMKVSWINDLSQPAKATLVSLLTHHSCKMSDSEIVNSIYSLGKMGCNWPSLGGKCQKNVLVNVQRVAGAMAAPALSNTFW